MFERTIRSVIRSSLARSRRPCAPPGRSRGRRGRERCPRPPRCPGPSWRASPRRADRPGGRGPCRWSTCGTSRGGSGGPARADGRAPAAAGGSARRSCRTRCPGSTRMSCSGHRPGALLDRPAEVVEDLGDEIGVDRLVAVVHEDDRHPAVRGEPRQRVVVRDAPDVVDRIGAGGEGGLGNLRLRRVDRQGHLGQRRANGLDHRDDAAELLVIVHRGVPGARGFAADVEQVGAVLGHGGARARADRPVRRGQASRREGRRRRTSRASR